MLYGKGFWCVENGVRLPVRTYPDTRGFEYASVDPADKTGDRGEWLIRNWCFDYVPPGEADALRFTIMGNLKPVLHENAFDFDWASIPKLARTITCDKADYRIRAACLPHDMGFCVHEFWPGFDIKFWNRMIFEIMEAYSVSQEDVDKAVGFKAKAKMKARYLADKALRYEVLAGVTMGGSFAWPKTPEEITMYSKLLKVEPVLEYKGFTL